MLTKALIFGIYIVNTVGNLISGSHKSERERERERASIMYQGKWMYISATTLLFFLTN